MKQVNDFESKVKVKLTWYFKVKLHLLIIFSYLFDISKWHANFVQDVQENTSRYIKVKIEPPGKEKGSDLDLSASE